MTQLILQHSNYLLNQIKVLFGKILNLVKNITETYMEARQRQANVEIARQLMDNKDFKNYSFTQILKMLESKQGFDSLEK